MEIIWIILAFVLAFIGLAGALLPGLPGPPIAFFGFGADQFYRKNGL